MTESHSERDKYGLSTLHLSFLCLASSSALLERVRHPGTHLVYHISNVFQRNEAERQSTSTIQS
jgi:hypothetical protein